MDKAERDFECEREQLVGIIRELNAMIDSLKRQLDRAV